MPTQSKLHRALLGTPFLVIFALGVATLLAYNLPLMDYAVETGFYEFYVSNETSSESVFGIPTKAIDDWCIWRAFILSDSSKGEDPMAWWQMLSFLLDWGCVHAIMLVEATRSTTTWSPAKLCVFSFPPGCCPAVTYTSE